MSNTKTQRDAYVLQHKYDRAWIILTNFAITIVLKTKGHMTELEQRINNVLAALQPQNKVSKTLSSLKKTLNSSSHIVDTVNNLGDNLQDNIKDGVGGIAGKLGGWVAGKTTKLAGGIAGGVIAGTLKTVAGVIPDASDLKLPETDQKIARCIETYSLPLDKNELFALLQYCWGNVNASTPVFGQQTLGALRALHERAHTTFLTIAKEDSEMQHLAHPYFPKKKFSMFK